VSLASTGASRAPSNVCKGRSVRAFHRSSSVHDLNDPDLAKALAERDEDALAELYDRYRRLAFVIALRIVHDPGTAEDVVQDSFLKLWNNAVQFEADRGSLRTWLITTVRNRAIDSLRGRAAHEREECELKPGVKARGAMLDSSRVSVSVERTPVLAALESLPLEQRLAVELAYFGSYTQPEIAGMMGVPLGTVKGRTRLGLKKLGCLLSGKGGIDF
jgi:RNA polymerase sigma-70 factor (ECF subfamily)